MTEDAAVAGAMRAYVEETAPVLALRLDARHRVAEANAEAHRVLGAHLPGRAFEELIVDFTRPRDVPALLRQEGVVHRLNVATTTGTPETIGFRFFPLTAGTLALGSLDFREQQSLREQVLGLNRELNNLTRQLHQANAELRELNQLKNQFLGMAAHDLRKPIGVIMTYGELVLDEAGKELAPPHREFLRTCLRAATGMRQVIDDFLDLSVIESGQLRLDAAAVSVAEILTGIEPMIRLLAEKKRVVLAVDAAEPARKLRVDAGKIEQVLLNLVGNAIEHSVASQHVELATRWEGPSLAVSVRDEGPGIGPGQQARLFKAFGRAGGKKTGGERSTGLGLTIARLIVEAHGGRIWVESPPGQGATFRFTLPGQR